MKYCVYEGIHSHPRPRAKVFPKSCSMLKFTAAKGGWAGEEEGNRGGWRVGEPGWSQCGVFEGYRAAIARNVSGPKPDPS